MKKYKIAVAGTGYVGLSIATLLSQHHHVTAVDIVPEKVEMINNRKPPIQDDYIEKYLAEKDLDLTATLDAKDAYSDDLIDNNQKDLEWWTAKHNWYSNREVLDHQMTLENEMDESLEQDGTSSGQAKMKRVVKNSGYYRLPKFFRAHLYFIYRYYIKLGFLDGPEGKIFHFLQAYWYRFLVDAKIYECEKKGTKMKPQGDLKA